MSGFNLSAWAITNRPHVHYYMARHDYYASPPT